jgi:NitT/TauT family transport system substrate-binding protein
MHGSAHGRHALLVLAALVCALTLAACGGDDDGGDSGSAANEPVTLKVGVIPIADVAPLYVGMEQGLFEREGITIEPKLAEGGAAIVPAVMAGDDDIGFSNATSLVIAASKKLPLQIISQGVQGGKGEDDAFDGLFVKKGGPIREVADLAGKTISVNNLNNVGPLTINNALEKQGVDPQGVKYLEVPFPDAVAALKAGRVDAIWVVEPFRSQAAAEGHELLMTPFEEAAPNYTVANYFASREFIERNPEVVDRFVRAMNASLEYAQTHPEAVRKAVLSYTKIPEAAARDMVLPTWGADLRESDLQLTADLAAKYGFIESKPDLGELVRQAG